MKVCFDGVRKNLSGAYNDLVEFLRDECDLSEWQKRDISERLEPLRMAVGTMLLLEDEGGSFGALDDELDCLESSDLEEE